MPICRLGVRLTTVELVAPLLLPPPPPPPRPPPPRRRRRRRRRRRCLHRCRRLARPPRRREWRCADAPTSPSSLAVESSRTSRRLRRARRRRRRPSPPGQPDTRPSRPPSWPRARAPACNGGRDHQHAIGGPSACNRGTISMQSASILATLLLALLGARLALLLDGEEHGPELGEPFWLDGRDALHEPDQRDGRIIRWHSDAFDCNQEAIKRQSGGNQEHSGGTLLHS